MVNHLSIVESVMDALVPSADQPYIDDMVTGWTGGSLEGDARVAAAAALRSVVAANLTSDELETIVEKLETESGD
ncbi:hypothetical protein [Amycolatopsis sp. CA-230715]|uniref:hypothetical protein n=1 Tax=Amycolatopsis sp. CA-230715 TaxID=2745196 RepID=UPI001C027500|nr:hypothetical protein [Amycolatopsis sp. CA-230715]QWF85794.1 hypothetical protein HUW46_09274 [Amycolatopsis sp. CA-230715]